jgi:hypothetical protein
LHLKTLLLFASVYEPVQVNPAREKWVHVISKQASHYLKPGPSSFAHSQSGSPSVRLSVEASFISLLSPLKIFAYATNANIISRRRDLLQQVILSLLPPMLSTFEQSQTWSGQKKDVRATRHLAYSSSRNLEL